MITAELKRKIRKLKQAEIRIRFGGTQKPNTKLVWDSFFDSGKEQALKKVSQMTRSEYDRLIEDFFARVYYEFYQENGIIDMMQYKTFNPALLAAMDLPPSAAEQDIKTQFRALAKQHHPDNNGNPEKFVEIMKAYKELIGG